MIFVGVNLICTLPQKRIDNCNLKNIVTRVSFFFLSDYTDLIYALHGFAELVTSSLIGIENKLYLSLVGNWAESEIYTVNVWKILQIIRENYLIPQ